MDSRIAVLKEKYCVCGYKAVAYIAGVDGERFGFKDSVIVPCPCCGRKITI